MRYKIITSIAAILAVAGTLSAQQWAPAGDRIKTKWAEEVSPTNAHPEYPRPQMVRSEWQSLNGLWDYAITPKSEPKPAKFDGKILVPFAVESSLSGVGKRVGEERLVKACRLGLVLQNYSYQAIEQILTNRQEDVILDEEEPTNDTAPTIPVHKNIRGKEYYS